MIKIIIIEGVLMFCVCVKIILSSVYDFIILKGNLFGFKDFLFFFNVKL